MTSLHCHPPLPSNIPTGRKGLINHITNMVASQVSGLSNEDSKWKIVKHKKKKEQKGGNIFHR